MQQLGSTVFLLVTNSFSPSFLTSLMKKLKTLNTSDSETFWRRSITTPGNTAEIDEDSCLTTLTVNFHPLQWQREWDRQLAAMCKLKLNQ